LDSIERLIESSMTWMKDEQRGTADALSGGPYGESIEACYLCERSRISQSKRLKRPKTSPARSRSINLQALRRCGGPRYRLRNRRDKI